jgi:hypothetical protein
MKKSEESDNQRLARACNIEKQRETGGINNENGGNALPRTALAAARARSRMSRCACASALTTATGIGRRLAASVIFACSCTSSYLTISLNHGGAAGAK